MIASSQHPVPVHRIVSRTPALIVHAQLDTCISTLSITLPLLRGAMLPSLLGTLITGITSDQTPTLHKAPGVCNSSGSDIRVQRGAIGSDVQGCSQESEANITCGPFCPDIIGGCNITR